MTNQRTPLHDRHVAAGARIVDFGGWDMPVQYTGIAEEHGKVRTAAGLFDVSHMGEVFVTGPGAESWLQFMTCNDVSKLTPGRIHYTGMLYESGGFVDDLLIYRLAEDSFLLVINAGNTPKDIEWLVSHLPSSGVSLEDRSDETALIAIQGPRAEGILQSITDVDLAAIRYYRFAKGPVAGHEVIVSRTGYTGEDGFEVYAAREDAGHIWDALLEAGRGRGLARAGLGARDTLRLEAGLALYGNDIDAETSPLEAGINFIVKLGCGDFIGRAALQRQKTDGLGRRLVGFEMIDRGIARHGHEVVAGAEVVGRVTSGTKTPTVGKAIGMGIVPIDSTAIGSEITIRIRNRDARARVVPTPFYKREQPRSQS